MKLLILGGTIFLGPHLVEMALAHGHEVTLFNRGQHHPDLFPEAEKLRGDRDGNLDALRGRRWDAVIDTCGYVPRIARASAEVLANAVDHYTFISTISVYEYLRQTALDEGSPVSRLSDPTVEEIGGGNYGALKVLCEEAVEEVMPGRVLVVRPGLIVGPHDPTDRFTYWPVRLAAGGDVLAPGPAERPVQYIDVRDLAGWTLRMVEAKRTGIFNATGPARPLPMGEFLKTCQAVTSNDAQLTWVSEEFLLAEGVEPFTQLPLWLPDEAEAMNRTDIRKASAAGLTFRSLERTLRDTLDWHASRPAPHPLRAGLPAEREAELLHAWHTGSRAES